MTRPEPHRAVLFADVVGSTSIYRRLGDARAEALIRTALERVAAAAGTHGGSLVKTIGDCAMCELPDGNAAARTAMDVHRQSAAMPRDLDEITAFRIGFTVGPVVLRDGDVFGDAVNIAARLCDMAKAGQILTDEASTTGLDPDIRNQIRIFDHTPVKGVTESLTIVQLLWEQRDATQIFVAPGDLGLPQAGQLVLVHDGRRMSLGAADLPFSIGRESGCRLVVPSPCASRVHAHIELRRGKFTWVDESTNGSYILPEGEDPERAVYLRREVFTLLGRGLIALGERPDPDSAHILRYELS